MKAKEQPTKGQEREIEEESRLIVSIDQEIKIRADREVARLDIAYIGKYMGGQFRASSEVSEAGFFAFKNLPLLPKSQLQMISHALEITA